MSAEAEGFKHGTCRWCGDETSVFTDNDLCRECDSDVVFCDICKQERHRHDTCRHVFEDEELDWSGAGIAAHPSDAAKEALFKLFREMPDGFVPELRQAIEAGRFHTWLIAPLIGGGGVLTLYGMERGVQWGDAMLELGERDDCEAMTDGYQWLASLYNSDTPEANAATIALIDEFLSGSAA